MAPRWGLSLPLSGIPLPAHRDLVRSLPDLGYTDLWSAETAGTDAFTPLALAAEWAPALNLGTAIAPVFTRGPALLAMSAATIAELAPGRFTLGIGSSSATIVEGWNGGVFHRPYQRVRDTLVFLRAALAGEKVSADYDTFSISRFRLDRPPVTPPDIMVAALRPGMLRLAARLGDGAITNWLAPADVAAVRAELRPGTELVARILVCPTADKDAARALGRLLISSYLTVPVYAAFHEWLGRGEMLRPMQEAWARGDRAAANAAIPDSVVDELIVHGQPDECRERVASYVDAGVTVPIMSVLPTGGDPAEVVRTLAPKG
ncbi:LLM class F420-dependent oxidoreductase [Actinokineospora diospyrosa]|uniref:F420-dependent oxidoreductase, Rv3093c family n=1 Tax=Actinokineospora diospyrosa TaxID=103728 RepID=A0ABT1I559_9PSEU|nr:LLM class F420-dependent oxidoreductase [Actinokineospora diospyrosa]MCP2267709.1 putative F420-dependent oxidoreductase, Rv3093c family [Actinokineospora diospyrosa]